MIEYLDKKGLSYLWGKVKNYVISTLPSKITNEEMDTILDNNN